MFWLDQFSAQIKKIEESVILSFYPPEMKLTPREGIIALDPLIDILWVVECEIFNLESGRKSDDRLRKQIKEVKTLAIKIKEKFLTMIEGEK